MQHVNSLVNQTTPTAALNVLHHQHVEGGSIDLQRFSKFLQHCFKKRMYNTDQSDYLVVGHARAAVPIASVRTHVPSHADLIGPFFTSAF